MKGKIGAHLLISPAISDIKVVLDAPVTERALHGRNLTRRARVTGVAETATWEVELGLIAISSWSFSLLYPRGGGCKSSDVSA